jgi:type II secretory pathway pseudopilin PulG
MKTRIHASRIWSNRMKRNINAETGMSLVEATIILMVLALLTAVIAPSAGDYIEEARNTKAKGDVEAIGTGIVRLVRDTGLPCLSKNGVSCSKANKIELLMTGSSTTANLPTADAAAFTTSANFASAASLNWAGGANAVAAANRDVADNHLVTNAPVGGGTYTAAGFTGGGGPKFGIGWRGAYLTGPIDTDPWGYAYQVNTVFSGVATDATAGTGEGALSGGWSADLKVISAGSNGNIQTLFGSANGEVAAGDDVVYTIQGSTR